MQQLFNAHDMPADVEDLLGPRIGMRLIEVATRIYNGQDNAVSGAGMRMLSDGNVYPNPFNAPYGVYPANEESLRHAARMDQDQWDVHREALLRPLESTPDGYYICKPILSMDAVLSRFADNLHNLNQRRENDANRQRQARARKKAGKTGHVTKCRRTSGGDDPDITLPGATNSNGHVTNSVTQAASCHADSHVTPSLDSHVTASERAP